MLKFYMSFGTQQQQQQQEGIVSIKMFTFSKAIFKVCYSFHK